ncbi:MAG: hypothetical protein PHS19_06120 [Eubacteriales bacterium]|nr:hypothetical protein [Eubacteriales bacterium]
MNFNCSKNNSGLTERLEKALTDNRIFHAYIFEGRGNTDKVEFARSFIKGVLCPKNLGENCGQCNICDKIDHNNHEDIIYVEKEGLSVKDDAIKDIQEKLNIKALGDRNIVVISDSDTMTLRAQNRLLKTLEEPPGNSILILLAENMENLSQTILSRCVKYRIEGDKPRNFSEKARNLIEMMQDGAPVYEMNKYIEEYMKDRDKTLQLMDEIENVYINIITGKQEGASQYKFEDIYEKIQLIEEARKQTHQGMSASYALKNLILKMSL